MTVQEMQKRLRALPQNAEITVNFLTDRTHADKDCLLKVEDLRVAEIETEGLGIVEYTIVLECEDVVCEAN